MDLSKPFKLYEGYGRKSMNENLQRALEGLPLPPPLVDSLKGCTCTNASRPTIDITEKTAYALQDAMSVGRVSATQLVNGFLDRIEAYDSSGPAIRAMITVVDRNEALRLAKALDEERKESGPRSRLHGIPVIIKDSIDVEGFPTSGGTVVLKDAYPLKDAFLVKRLRDAGHLVPAEDPDEVNQVVLDFLAQAGL